MIKHKIGTKDNGIEYVNLTPLKAIRKKCLDCVCWSNKEVVLCKIELCPLWPYRFGKKSRDDDSRKNRGTTPMEK